MTGFNWVLDQRKFLCEEEVIRLLKTAEQRAKEALARGYKVAIRDYFIIHLALSTGLRVMEIAQLNCGDIFLGDGISSLLVRRGKGGKKRLVYFNGSFKHHYNEYTLWKQNISEPIGPGDPLILSSNTKSHMTTRAIEKAFKRTATRTGLPSHYSIHCLRHTYACHLYKASGYNLRLVQKQLGHSSSQITEVYADVMNSDLTSSLEKLYVNQIHMEDFKNHQFWERKENV
ncbi:MAG: tyrosine-type recombinase/integrase [Sedimentisphaerales bacterium]